MPDLFEEIFANQLRDPTEAARRAMRARPRRRFYRRAEVDGGDGQFRVVLDGRPVKTPARRMLAAPTGTLAQALAAEWQAQRDIIDPAKMPLTRLANTIIDGVSIGPAAVRADVEKYLASDLVLYRADGPADLVERQASAWDPVLAWADQALGARFVSAQGMVFVAQPAEALAAARAAIAQSVAHDSWRLGALHGITTLTGSALIALALMRGVLSLDQAWAAAHVDEDWNMHQWGRDELALERRAHRFAEIQAAATVLQTV
jgi:chaperone required for assembly of F1-ATPase